MTPPHRATGLARRPVDDPQHRHLGDPAHLVESAPRGAVNQAFVAHVAQQLLERDLVMAGKAERAGDLARADLSGLRPDEGEKLFLGRYGRAIFRVRSQEFICERNRE